MGKKKNEDLEETKTASVVQISNWDDWFRNCGDVYKDLLTYEDDMQKYYNLQNSKTEAGRMQASRSFQSNHVSKFYEKNVTIPMWKKKKILFVGVISFGIGFLAFLLLFLLLFRLKMDKIDVIKSVCGGAVISIAISAIMCFIHSFQVKRLTNDMDLLDEKLRDRVSYIPPKYRNSQAVNIFYDLWSTYGIVTFNQAVAACDDYLLGNNMIGAYMAELFDVPYKNAGVAQDYGASTDRGLYASGEKPNDPNLPDDIVSKTYKGPEDADAKLNELIGLDNVKNQVRQMKNRMHSNRNG